MPEETTKQGDQTPQPKAASTTTQLEEKAPDPAKSGGKVVRTQWPSDKFVVEGLPVITREGVRVSADDYKKLQEIAKLCNVKIVEVTE